MFILFFNLMIPSSPLGCAEKFKPNFPLELAKPIDLSFPE